MNRTRDWADKRAYRSGYRMRMLASWLTAPRTWTVWQGILSALVYAAAVLAIAALDGR